MKLNQEGDLKNDWKKVHHHRSPKTGKGKMAKEEQKEVRLLHRKEHG